MQRPTEQHGWIQGSGVGTSRAGPDDGLAAAARARSASVRRAGLARVPRPEAPARVLVVSDVAGWRKRVRECLGAAGLGCVETPTQAGALRLIGTREGKGHEVRFDAAVVDGVLPDAPGTELIAVLRDAGLSVIFADHDGIAPSGIVAAVRAGARDIIDPARVGAAELIERVWLAAENSRRARRRAERMCTLKRLCGRLRKSRDEVARQVDALCSDLVQAYQEIAMSQTSVAQEFKGLIRQELDIETLLRTTLEFVLGRSGPTNAAVFLPTTSGDYSLGAYVNYDCPKDTCDVMLDHLANTVAHRFEAQIGVCHMQTRDAVEDRVGDEAEWLGDSGVVAFACRHEGETLAVFMLFRDRENAFAAPLLQQLQTVSELFAAQLARVIHIHHRHLPKEKWGMLGDPPADDYGDLAA